MIGTATLIALAVATAVMAAGATTYHATDGFGAGNKIKSSRTVRQDRTRQQTAAREVQTTVQSGDRHFVQREQTGLSGTQPTRPVRATQPTQPTAPTLPTLPTAPTGYYWQEYSPKQHQQILEQSQLFIDRYDTQANSGLLSTTRNTYLGKGWIERAFGFELSEEQRAAIRAASMFVPVVNLLNISDTLVSAVDNFVWDLDGDKDSLLKNVLADPWIEVSKGKATWGQAILGNALNTLNGMVEVFDILANPIKGIAADGPEGFLHAFGLGGEGYVVYDWDTGSFTVDLIAEMLSDPTFVVSLAKSAATLGSKAAARSAGKVGARAGAELAQEMGEQGTKAASKAFNEAAQESLTKLTTSLEKEVAPKIVTSAGRPLSTTVQKELSQSLATELIQRGAPQLSQDAMESLFKEVVEELQQQFGTRQLSRAGLKNLNVSEVVSRKVTDSLKKLAKEAGTRARRKLFNASAKRGLTDSVGVSAQQTGRKQVAQLTDIIETQGQKVLEKTNKKLGRGSLSEIITEGGKPVVKIQKTVQDVGEGVFKAAENISDEATNNLTHAIIRDAQKAGIPITQETVMQIRRGAQEYISKIDFDKMATQVMSATGIVQKQSRVVRADKVAGWLNKANLGVNKLQSQLNKIALYGTNPTIPLIGKAFMATPWGKIIARGGNELLSTVWAKISNNRAYLFQKQVARAFGELTPESYIILRNTFSWASDNLADTLADTVKIGSKEVIQKNKLLPQTAESAFQRQWVAKLNQDIRTYNRLLKTQPNVESVTQAWEQYLLRNYRMNANTYFDFIKKINAIEQNATGSAIYDVFIRDINRNNALIEATTLMQTVRGKTKEPIKFVTGTATQGARLSETQLKAFGAEVFTPEEYHLRKTTLANEQAFIQTNNKALVEDELYTKMHKLLDDWEYSEGQEGILAYLSEAGFEKETERIVTALQRARDINQQLTFFRANTALYAVLPEGADPKHLYVALSDAFMGLNNKVRNLDDLESIVYELAAIVEFQYPRLANITEDMTGRFTQDMHFMTNLRASVSLYLEGLPDKARMITELKDIVSEFQNIYDRALINVKTDVDIKTLQQMKDIIDNISGVSVKAADNIVVLPGELFRSGMDLMNDTSIHEAMLKVAGGGFPGTLTTINDGRNLGMFFEAVDATRQFNRAVVDEAQNIANGASMIYDRMYIKEVSEAAIKRTNEAWDEFLRLARNSTFYNNDDYYKQLLSILESTRGLEVNKKYALLKQIYESTNSTSKEIAELHRVSKFIDGDAYSILKRDILNFSNRSNKAVTTGVGLDVQRARKIILTDPNKRVLGDLQDILSERARIGKSIDAMEMQLKNVANADPLLAQHLIASKQTRNFYDNQIAQYQQMIEAAINTPAITTNMGIVNAEHAKDFFSADDIETLDRLYKGVADVDPEAIAQLERRAEAYNKTIVSPELFREKFDEDIIALHRKRSLGTALTEQEELRLSNYSDAIKEYDRFAELMTKRTLTSAEADELLQRWGDKLERYQLTPNAAKVAFTEQQVQAGLVRMRMNPRMRSLGQTSGAGRNIEISSHILRDFPTFEFTTRHEMTHSALSFKSVQAHRKAVEQFWTHLMNGPNKEYMENLYLGVWWQYQKAWRADQLSRHYFNSDIFTWNNIHIQEEVMANVVAGIKNPALLDARVASYAKENYRMWRPEAVKLQIDEALSEAVEIHLQSALKEAAMSSPNRIYDVPWLQEGYRLDINKPFEQVGAIMREYRQSDKNRMLTMMRKRLSQNATQFAEDLARTGPFQFYSMSALRGADGRYSLFKYFDNNFKPRAAEVAKLKAAGVGFEVFEEMDTVMFYIDKSRVGYYNGGSYYDRKLIRYSPTDFNYESRPVRKDQKIAPRTSLQEMGNEFNKAAHEIAGQTTGYSNGFRMDENFLNTLFNGTKDGATSDVPSWIGLNNIKAKNIGGWTQADLLSPGYFTSYRFNEMLMGDFNYTRRFGAFHSPNPVVNMSNALQQMHTMNKAKIDMLSLFFDNMFSIAKGGIWGDNATPEQLFDSYMKHPEYTLVSMRGNLEGKTNALTRFMLGDGWNPVRLQEIIPFSAKDMSKAMDAGARLVPRSWYNMMYNTINNRIGSGGLLKYINRYNFIYKFFTLISNPMTFVRNASDTYFKNLVELGEDMPIWTAHAWKIQSDYQNIVNILKEKQIHGEKAIKAFFESGEALAYTQTKDMTYDLFNNLRSYEAWGPSTRGLADLVDTAGQSGRPTAARTGAHINEATRVALEATDDELMRGIAREIVPGYKGVWETAVDMSSQVFDIANNTIGIKAEKVNRLALYLKAIAEGQTKEQAFHWITKVHFDYSVRNLYEQSIEMLMPFITFTVKNAEYWFRAIQKEPWVARFLMDYFQAQWNYYDFDPTQMAASQQVQQQILTGNIPLWKREDGAQAYFKLNPSYADAFQTFVNPLEVAKQRLFFPTRAIDKSFSTDYKGQNLMGKQDTWYQVLDWTSSLPGNALARRITGASTQPDPLSIIGEASGAIGHTRIYKPYGTTRTGKRVQMKFIYNQNNQTYYQRMRTQPYNRSSYTSKSLARNLTTQQVQRWKSARASDIGKRILDPLKATGQRLTQRLFFKNKPTTSVMTPSRTRRRLYSMTQYKVQRGLFTR